MAFSITDEDVRSYRDRGYFIIRQVIPASLLGDLRREARKGRELAYRIHGPQSQRLSPLGDYTAALELKAFRDFNAIEGLHEAVRALTSPRHVLGTVENITILFQPRDRPWSTEWHRDWRHHVIEAEFQAEVGDARWQEIANSPDFFNQINCPLFEDTSTWYVPGSHRRVTDSAAETAVFRSSTQEELRDESNRRTNEELELYCLRYCQAMPGAVQAVLNPGDFMLYRNLGWHLGNYVPYRERLTLHTHAVTPEFRAFATKFGHLLKPREASIERHALGAR